MVNTFLSLAFQVPMRPFCPVLARSSSFSPQGSRPETLMFCQLLA
ncbi:hypothetical protein [Kitasatospora sp. NPDC059827]